MCVLNYKRTGMGSLFDGIPVVNDLANLKKAVEKYQINYVILASASMPEEIRNQIKDLCREIRVEAQDYSGFFRNTGNHINFRNLAECSEGPVELVIHGDRQEYPDGRQALRNVFGNYFVKSVSAGRNALVIELADDTVVQNDLNADWVRDQEKETGEEISFF